MSVSVAVATVGVTPSLTPESVRRWLGKLSAPDRLGRDPQMLDLLRRLERVGEDEPTLAAGRSAVALLREAIERLRPAAPSSRRESVPYDVAKLCFVDDVPLLAAADRLGMSARQLTRERARAVAMILDELASLEPIAVPTSRPGSSNGSGHSVGTRRVQEYRFEPIPAIAGFLPRPQVAATLTAALAQQRPVHVHGPAGGGKTSLVADLASTWVSRLPTLWCRLRPGVNDSLPALLFELGQHLQSHGRAGLADTIAAAVPNFEPSLVSRIAVQELSGHEAIFVFDDYHIATGRPGLSEFLEDIAGRISSVQVITIGRTEQPRLHHALDIEVPLLHRNEIRALLRQLGDRAADEHVDLVAHWTHGVPYLVQLATSWLATADPDEVGSGEHRFSDHADVQVFLLDALTGLMDSSDRHILEAASIFRDRFTDAALAYVAGRTVGQIADTSRRLVTSHLASRSRQNGIALFCEVLREYVYQRLDEPRRRELHSRAADWYRDRLQAEEAEFHAMQAARLGG